MNEERTKLRPEDAVRCPCPQCATHGLTEIQYPDREVPRVWNCAACKSYWTLGDIEKTCDLG
jgi:hypothetical protein